jgi:hypothetical protein
MHRWHAVALDQLPGLSDTELTQPFTILSRLASPYAGEVAFAVATAMCWHNVLTPLTLRRVSLYSPTSCGTGVTLSIPASARPQIAWEQQFVAPLARCRHQPSGPQLDILATVTSRVLGGGAR